MDFPAYLATMPMHAITEIHGEPGLLQQFRLEIRAFDEPARQRLIAALELAADLHRDDRRVREPYLNHLLGMIHTVGPKVVSSATKYRPLVPVFRDLVTRPDTPLSAAVKQHILDQLDLAEERFSAILDQPA